MPSEKFSFTPSNRNENTQDVGMEDAEGKILLDDLKKDALNLLQDSTFMQRIAGSPWVKRITFLITFLTSTSAFAQEGSGERLKQSIEGAKEALQKIVAYVNNSPDKVITIGQSDFDEAGNLSTTGFHSTGKKFNLDLKEKDVGDYRIFTRRDAVVIRKKLQGSGGSDGDKNVYYLDSKGVLTTRYGINQFKTETQDTTKIKVGQVDGVLVVPTGKDTISDEKEIELLGMGENNALVSSSKEAMERMKVKDSEDKMSHAFGDGWVIFRSTDDLNRFYKTDNATGRVTPMVGNTEERLQTDYELTAIDVASQIPNQSK